MSPTIRVNERVKEAIESYRAPDQNMNEAVEQMAEELGLFGDRRVADFREKLSDEYGFDEPQISEIETALRILYLRQVEPNLTVPATAVSEFDDELSILERFDLVAEQAGRYSVTDTGKLIVSVITEEELKQQTEIFDELLADRHELLLAFLVEFGFNKTQDQHLISNLSPLSTEDGDHWWSDHEMIQTEYESLKTQLVDPGVAVRNEFQETRSDEAPVVLPPEFEPVLAEYRSEMRSALEQMECYRVILRFAEDEFEVRTRERIVQTLQIASEGTLKQVVNTLHEDGFVSQYTENETPFLVKSKDDVLAKIHQQLAEVNDEI